MLEALREITQQISRAADLNEALGVVVRSVKACLALDACSVYFLDESGEKCVLTATAGLDPRAIGSVRTVDREGLVGIVVRNQQAVSFASSQQPQRIRHFPEFGEQEYHSFLGVPILHFAKTLGVLSGQQMDDRAWFKKCGFWVTPAPTSLAKLRAIIRLKLRKREWAAPPPTMHLRRREALEPRSSSQWGCFSPVINSFGTLAGSFGDPAAHEGAMIEEELQQAEVRLSQLMAQEKVVRSRELKFSTSELARGIACIAAMTASKTRTNLPPSRLWS